MNKQCTQEDLDMLRAYRLVYELLMNSSEKTLHYLTRGNRFGRDLLIVANCHPHQYKHFTHQCELQVANAEGVFFDFKIHFKSLLSNLDVNILSRFLTRDLQDALDKLVAESQS